MSRNLAANVRLEGDCSDRAAAISGRPRISAVGDGQRDRSRLQHAVSSRFTDERTGATIVLDAGSGIVGLGPKHRWTQPREPAHSVVTHYHWDHLQGCRFSSQLYVPGWTRGSMRPGSIQPHERVIGCIFNRRFFPSRTNGFPNRPIVEMLAGTGNLTIGGFDISATV